MVAADAVAVSLVATAVVHLLLSFFFSLAAVATVQAYSAVLDAVLHVAQAVDATVTVTADADVRERATVVVDANINIVALAS